ncbi:MAG: hypothetical protein KGH59_03055 [Candidatus Micrarchaeota archaeon]|nr:hypothetical protein [Candidatus Micrarchaeota archaeon]MDE1804735.1 hypothetical protein [Candidatus Micrarchaeota archaeon]MDE1847002.1 hypothetical protein [Candidatus Micrarchaeota archaeon]
MEAQSKRDSYRDMLVLLVIASALLIAGSAYFIQIFSMQYGVGGGALIQSTSDNSVVVAGLQQFSTQLSGLYRSVIESWLSLILATLLLMISFMLYLGRANRFDEASRRNLMLHLTVSVIYIILFGIIYSGFVHQVISVLLYLGIFGMLACVITDAYLEYSVLVSANKRPGARSISINPETPYTNMQVLRSQLFSMLKGNIRIVDKHFNSEALANLHRLIASEIDDIDSISIITSQEMLDGEFSNDYKDFYKELKNKEVGLEVKVMTPEDASAQHERFILDDENAFKVPPLNIINRKSEHITKINLHDARKRFDYLHQRALKLENYLLRQDRKPQQD